MNKKNAAILVTRLTSLGLLGSLMALALYYVPGAWEMLVAGLVGMMIPLMFLMTVGLIEVSTFESINLLSKVSKSEFWESWTKPAPEPEPI